VARAGEGDGMKIVPTETGRFQEILERKKAELDRVLRRRDDIAIEKSADQMDEIQYATERDLAIRNVDRDSTLLRQVRASLQRIQDGSFGACIASPKNSEGQILNGKVRARKVGGFYPALHFGIVGLVENRFHSRRRPFKSSMGSVNEQDPNETAKSRRAAAISRWLS